MLGTIVLAALGLQSPIKNVKIAPMSAGGFQPCEPSIAISPRNPKVIVAGVILDRAFSSTDGGQTWSESVLKSPYGVFGDPTIIADKNGDFYFFHLSSGQGQEGWLDRIVCQKSTDNGRTWNSGASIGHNPPADQDKQWAAVAPDGKRIVATWTQFDKYGSKEPGHRSNIMFSQSLDGGLTWLKQERINEVDGDCIDSDNTVEGAVPAIDNKGNIFCAWSVHGTLYFDRSEDGGKSWLAKDTVVGKQVGGWDTDIPGLGRSNGMPVLMADNSGKKNDGTLYIVHADQRAGVNDTDIFITKSTDQGKTWSKEKRINQDAPGKHQFMPWLAVDDETGYLYVVYYDRRAYDDLRTDVYVAYSTDAGETFTEVRVSNSPFVPSTKAFFGDYNNISASHGVIAPVWTRMDDGKTSVWTAVTTHPLLVNAGM